MRVYTLKEGIGNMPSRLKGRKFTIRKNPITESVVFLDPETSEFLYETMSVVSTRYYDNGDIVLVTEFGGIYDLMKTN